MTFLNAALLAGTLGFVVPLAIHLLNRNRHRTVSWGAMHLLDSVVRTNRRRLRLDQLILLLIRCAIPVVLALCLARPVLTQFKTLIGDAPLSLVLVVDDSYSMNATTGDDTATRFDAATAAAAAISEATAAGSDVTVLLTGGSVRPLFDTPVYGGELIADRLDDRQAIYGASNMVEALDEALAITAGSQQVAREIVVLSDFQTADWETYLTGEAADRFRDRRASLDIAPAVSLIPLGGRLEQNVSVEGLDFSGRPLATGQRLDVRVILRNHGDQPVNQLPVTLRLDDEQPELRRVTIAAESRSQVLFRPQFAEPGSHRLQVEIESSDDIAADDHLEAVAIVWDRLPVLLVDGAPSAEPLAGETDFLTIALTPLTLGGSELTDLIETRTVTASELTAEAVSDVRLVVLANVARLTDASLAAVRDFAASGGAVLITAGDRIDPQWASTTLFDAGLLPRQWGELVTDDEPARITAGRFEHPGLAAFNETGFGDLTTAAITTRYRFDSRDDPEQPELIALTLDNGDPLLVERPLEAGVVLQLATSIDADWTDLPKRPVFVPLVQQLAAQLATRVSPPRNVGTGEPVVAIFEQPQPSIDVITPGGESVRIGTEQKTPTQHVARFEQTQQPGFYVMEPTREADDDGDATGDPDDWPLFAVQAARSESTLERLDSAARDELASSLSATVATDVADYLSRDRERRHGRDIWTWALGLLVVLLFAEVLFAQWVAGRTG